MGNTPSDRRLAKKFEKEFAEWEIEVLCRVFRQLAKRSPKETVDLEHFDEYVKFPGLYTEQIFRAFDTKGTGTLDLDEFVTGFAKATRGTKAEKMDFLFKVYDLKGDGFVWRSELQQLITHLPFDVAPFAEDKKGLSYDDFAKWVDSEPRVLDYFDAVFGRAILAGDAAAADRDRRVSMPPANKAPVVPLMKRRCNSSSALDDMAAATGGDAESSSSSIFAESSSSASSSSCPTTVRKEGYLQKVGAKTTGMKTRYFVFTGHCLHYFVKKGDRPRGVIFLGGCQIEKLADQPKAFRVVHLDAERLGQRPTELYAASSKERDDWVDALIFGLSRWGSCKSGALDVSRFYDLGAELGEGKFAVVRKARDRTTGALVAVKSIKKRALAPNGESSATKEGGENSGSGGSNNSSQGSSPKKKTGGMRRNSSSSNMMMLMSEEDKVALKNEAAMFRREIAVMRLARHASILPLLDVVEDRATLHLVTPLMESNLLDYLVERRKRGDPCDEGDARVCLPPLLEAVAYLHHLGVAHRDLKPDNILMENSGNLRTLRVADFSISHVLKPDEAVYKCSGSLEYMSPEAILKDQGASFPADVWALGVIAVLVLFHQQPFAGRSKADTIANILDRNILPLEWHLYSNDARDLIDDNMLHKDPALRITAKHALQAHPWVTTIPYASPDFLHTIA